MKGLLRGLKKTSLARIATYFSYAHYRVFLSVLTVTSLMIFMHTAILIFMLPPPFSTGPFLAPIIALTSFFYVFVIVYLISVFTSELSTGGALLFLSFPLSRVEYVFSWILNSVVAPSLLYLLSIAIPVAVIDPTLVLNISGVEITLAVLEMTAVGTVIFLLSLITKNRKTALSAGILLYLVVPYLGLIAFSYFKYSLKIDLSNTPVFWVYEALYPYKAGLFVYGSVSWSYNLAFPTAILIALILAATLFYSKYRLEVV